MKTIIITGANGNLGTATVKKFLDEGVYRVIAVDHSGTHLGFADAHHDFELHSIELTDETATNDFVTEAISLYGQIDGALLLAGGFSAGSIEATSTADLQKMYNLNFVTAYHMIRPLFNHMLKTGYGRIVLIGARPALKASQGKNLLAYSLSKSLLFKLAELLNEEAKGENVVVSVVVPSTIDTPVNRKSMPEANPGKWVQPEQLADILEFICSDKGFPMREAVYKVYNDA